MTPDEIFMQRALELAGGGWGRVHPNPMVGAVIVQDDTVVGEGWHAEFGGPHAEVVALNAAQERARGATLYVSLEPCRHHGKTPPCTDAILAAGIRRVVFGAHDPTVKASGGGALLAGRGLEVTGGVLERQARRLNSAFHHFHTTGTPWVALKLAMSLDQKLSEKPGAPTAITGEAARAEVHRLRAGFDAILTSRATVEADDPLLTVRGDIEPRVPPVRVVLDTHARTSPSARLLKTLDAAPVWILSGPDADTARVKALEAAGALVLRARADEHGIDLHDALRLLAEREIRSILVEAGGRLATAFLAAGLVQRLHLFVAPRVLGEGGTPAFTRPGALAGWQVEEARVMPPDAWLVLEPATQG